MYLDAAAAGGAPPYSYAWNFGDGQTGTGGSVTHTYQVASSSFAGNIGSFLPTVTVTDANGKTCTTNPDGIVSMIGNPDSGTPFSVFPTSICELPYDVSYGTMWGGIPGAYAGNHVNFTLQDTTEYYINDGHALYGNGISGGVAPYSYAWDFGDGARATTVDVSHAYTQPGYYCVRLTATDSQGTTSEWATTVAIYQSESTLEPTPNPTNHATQTPSTSNYFQTPQPSSQPNSPGFTNTILIVAIVGVTVAAGAIAGYAIIRKTRKNNYQIPPPPPPPPP